MANIKQQIKRNKTNEKAHLRNMAVKSSTKTAIRRVKEAVKAGDKKLAEEKLSYAYKKLDSAKTKGVYHKNKVARVKSQLAKEVATIK